MGRTLEQAAADEGLAILILDSCRLERPERRSKSRGHGPEPLVDLGARLRDKKPVKPVKPLAIPVAPRMPSFLEQLLAK